jgi:hypothetical protein
LPRYTPQYIAAWPSIACPLALDGGGLVRTRVATVRIFRAHNRRKTEAACQQGGSESAARAAAQAAYGGLRTPAAAAGTGTGESQLDTGSSLITSECTLGTISARNARVNPEPKHIDRLDSHPAIETPINSALEWRMVMFTCKGLLHVLVFIAKQIIE